jgi:hypothetical protein
MAAMLPLTERQISPFADPGTLIPVPVSDVTGALNLTSDGLMAEVFE